MLKENDKKLKRCCFKTVNFATAALQIGIARTQQYAPYKNLFSQLLCDKR
jgi:hypothetical protein